ncbi:MAG: hypothetical protein M3406_05150 [Chloroflexota bacterium]|nr:hypothetical protein [Chloroflexota bacterium]
MRRPLSLLAAALLVASAIPATASAAVPDYQRVITSRFADAALASLDGCVLTEVFVSGTDAVFGGRPGPINRQGLAGVLVRQNDVCAGAASLGHLGIFAAGGGGGGTPIFDGLGQTLGRLGSTVHFDRAWVRTEIPVVNEVAGRGEQVVVALELTWSLVGDLDRDTGHLHVREPGEGNVNSHQNTLMGEATVSGTVRIGTDVYTFDGVDGAHLQQVKYGCQVIAHPSAGEPDLSC